MTAQLTVYTLGQPAILLDGRPLTGLTSRTAEALLIYLMRHKRPLSRQVLADFFWDERAASRAAANLRTLLTMLRKTLGDYLLIDRHSVGFNHDQPYWLDVEELEKQLANLEPIIQSPTPLTAEDADALQTAVDLYQGAFLSGFYLSESRGFDEWTTLTQEQLRRQVEEGLRRLIAYCLEAGLYEKGRGYAARLLTLDPYYEATHRQMMWLLVRSGQRNAALSHYQQCRRLLADELGVEPSPATTAVYNQIRALEFPPPCRLPASTAPFMGREKEAAAVSQQLSHPDCRLLSLLGPGGTGKTRLAVEVVSHLWRRQPGQFLHGCYFIPLETADAARQIPLLIAEKLGAALHGAAAPLDQLLDYLRDKETLLILDNVEHLLTHNQVEIADLLTQLLQAAPQIKLLVTSRHRLNLQDEWLIDLPGLDYPPENDPADPEQYSAPRLFLHHARRVRHDFAPTAADWQAIARLCQLLEGLPLGLELAAAWLRHSGCADIAAQVERQPRALASGYHDAVPRHRSLTAVFDYSWTLLAAKEQAIFAQLSLFRGPFTAVAAAAVAQATPAILRSLRDKSLLRLIAKPAGSAEAAGAAAQYDMHPLLRQFAADRLADNPLTAQETQERHGRYFAQLLADQESELYGPQEQERLNELRAALPDLRAAWQWANGVARQDSGPLAAMLYSLAYLHDVQALYAEGRELFQAAIDRLDQAETPALLAQKGRLLTWHGRFLYHLGHYDEARHSLNQAITLLRPLALPADLALALTYMGELARFESAFPLARDYQTESAALARAAGADSVAALALLHTGKIDIAEGNYQAAQAVCAAGLALAQRRGAPRQIAIFEDNLGTVALELGDYEIARQKLTASYELRRALRDQWGLAASLNNLGVLALAAGDYEAAVENSRQAETAFRQIGHRWGVAMALTNLGRAFAYQREYLAAQENLNQALRLWQETGSQLEEGDVWLYLGQVARQRGDYAAAQSWLRKSLALLAELGDERQRPIVWRDLGVTLTEQGELAEGARYLHLSLEAAVAQDITADALYALSGWAVWLARRGETAVARQLLTLAATHPTAWRHEQAEAERLLQKLGGAEKGAERLTVETAVALVAMKRET